MSLSMSMNHRKQIVQQLPVVLVETLVVGLVIEAGGIVVTVDEGRLDMHIKKGA